MEQTLSKEAYDELVEELKRGALEEIRDLYGDDLSTVDPDEVKSEDVEMAIVSAVTFTPLDALDGESLAAAGQEMTATFAGSIIDNSEAVYPREEYAIAAWNTSRHTADVAQNYIFADVHRGVLEHVRRKLSDDASTESAA